MPVCRKGKHCKTKCAISVVLLHKVASETQTKYSFYLGGINNTSLDFCSQWKKQAFLITIKIYTCYIQSLLPHLLFHLLAKICVQTKIVLYLVNVHKPKTKYQSFSFIHIDLIILVLLVYFLKTS